MTDTDADFDAAMAAAKKAAAEAADTPDDTESLTCPTCGAAVIEGSMLAAATSNDELKLLKAIRDRLAAAIEDCPMRDLSPLTRRLQDVMKELRELVERQAKESGTTKKVGDGGGNNPEGKWDPATDV